MKLLNVKIREREVRGPASYEYKNEIIFGDYRKLAVFFFDLETYGGNIEKAFAEYKRLKAENFPW